MRTSTRTSTRIAGVLAGLALALGGAALTAPAAHSDEHACINAVETELRGGEAPASIVQSCYVGLTGGSEQCQKGLTASGVTQKTAENACDVADD
ncbi:hypothetical protein AB0N09_18965 [Streptomyces erythrochromogenes]|uniref:hypothetical protein n=1 Tax=Streptomyces erythrochromogenes TaxID=285574 RepID=UPI003426C9F3